MGILLSVYFTIEIQTKHVCVSIDLNKTGTSLLVYKWKRGSSNMIYCKLLFKCQLHQFHQSQKPKNYPVNIQ